MVEGFGIRFMFKKFCSDDIVNMFKGGKIAKIKQKIGILCQYTQLKEERY